MLKNRSLHLATVFKGRIHLDSLNFALVSDISNTKLKNKTGGGSETAESISSLLSGTSLILRI